MKKVLVTGAGGFIGSHLVKALVEVGYEVTALVKYNSNSSWGWLDATHSSIMKDVKVVLGDVRDPEQMMRFKDMDIIFHLAALIGIPYSYIAPRSYLDTNVMGTLNILQACREKGALMVHTSTSEVYGTAQHELIDESHPIQTQSPYSASKHAADALVKSYHLSFDLPALIVRPFNTFGPRQSLRAVIPTIISQAWKNGVIRLGDIETERDFTFVDDTVNGFIKVADYGKPGEVYNIGCGKRISIKNIVELTSRIIERPLEIVSEKERYRPPKSEVKVLCCNNRKVRKIGWEPGWNFKSGLEYFAHWLKKSEKDYKVYYHV